VDAERVLAFRLARSGLASRDARSLAEAADCPASDFSRDAALLALAARCDGVSREGYDEAVETGELALAHTLRGAIHAQAPRDLGLYGRALIASRDEELGPQLGQQVQQLGKSKGFSPGDALAEVTDATKQALGGGRRLSKNELHEELRARVSPDLMPWCKGCESYHVAPMLWRYATVKAGARLDHERHYLEGRPGRAQAGPEAVRRFLGFYGPATAGDFADWAGLAKPHAKLLWQDAEDELTEVAVEGRKGWALTADSEALESPPSAEGVRLIPPGDPFLQKPNRPLLTPDQELRKRLFRPVASPGAVLRDGRLAGLWKVKAKGRKTEVTVEKLGRVARPALEAEAQRVADLRGGSDLALALSG